MSLGKQWKDYDKAWEAVVAATPELAGVPTHEVRELVMKFAAFNARKAKATNGHAASVIADRVAKAKDPIKALMEQRKAIDEKIKELRCSHFCGMYFRVKEHGKAFIVQSKRAKLQDGKYAVWYKLASFTDADEADRLAQRLEERWKDWL